MIWGTPILGNLHIKGHKTKEVFRNVPQFLDQRDFIEPDDSEDAGLSIENLQQIQDC